MKETILKKRVFFFLFTVKFIVILCIILLWQDGGFLKSQAIAAITMMIPIFTAYTTVMFKEIVEDRHIKEEGEKKEVPKKEKKVNATFKWLTYILFPLYALAILWVISLKPRGILEFDEMSGWIAAIESGLGVYIGQIVFALFKKSDLKKGEV